MTPEQAAHDTRDVLVRVTSGFMTAPGLFEHGAELGFEELDFYVAGRGGVLGDVPSAVVAAAFVYFREDAVRTRWERSQSVMPRLSAAQAFAAFAHRWALDTLPDDLDWERLAALLEPVVRGASVAAAPLFAGWRALDEPSDPKALAHHRMNAVRELRGALHAAAILTVGLTPFEAVSVRSPQVARFFGWDDPSPDPDQLRDRWNLAEARTDRMLGRHIAVLSADEREELVEHLGALA